MVFFCILFTNIELFMKNITKICLFTDEHFLKTLLAYMLVKMIMVYRLDYNTSTNIIQYLLVPPYPVQYNYFRKTFIGYFCKQLI